MESAGAELGAVEVPAEALVALQVVPLGLAGDGGADQATLLVVLVFVGLGRFPAEEPLFA